MGIQRPANLIDHGDEDRRISIPSSRDEAMGWTPHSKAVVFVLSFVLRKTITPMSLIIIIIILLLLFGGGGYAYRGTYGGGGGLGLVLVILLVLYLMGYIGH